MSQKIVGITCGTASETENAGSRQYLNRAYVWAIEQAGGIPVVLPVTQSIERARNYIGAIDGLLLSGGVDVNPARYASEPHARLGDVDPERDLTELAIIEACLIADLPIFAICRGVQVLNVALNGTLYQDLPSERPSDIVHSQKQPRNVPTHIVDIVESTRIQSLLGAKQIETNSFHHQAIKDLGDHLVVAAHASDGVIEAIESPDHRYVIGVQFHPEETAPHDVSSRTLFEQFISAL